MTNRTDTLRLRKLVLVPAALLVVGITTSSDGGERRVHVQGGKMLTQMEDGKMVLKGIQGEIGGGQIQMAGNVAAGSDSNSATLKFVDVPLAQAAEMLTEKELSGWLGDLAVTGFIKGEWQGKGIKKISSTADGAMVIETGPGIISDEAALTQLEKVTGIVELPELAYSKIKIQARAKDGKVLLDFIRAEGPDFTLSATGDYNASTDNLDVNIEATVSQELAAKSSYMKLNNVMSFLRGDDKAEAEGSVASDAFVNIPHLIVSGELMNPDVTIEKAKTETASVTASAGVDASRIGAGAKSTDSAEAGPAISDSVKRVSKFFLTQSSVPGN